MASTFETQRLISMSLGKIAQSRGQRGGINLHKNLLVATVLHKARAAYMMESYNYQQTLQRQQQQQKQEAEPAKSSCQLQQQQQRQSVQQSAEISAPAPMCVEQVQISTVSSSQSEALGRETTPQIVHPQSEEKLDSEVGQPDATRTDREECRADDIITTPVAVQTTPASDCESSLSSVTPEPIESNMQDESTDKENSPPAATETADSPTLLIASPAIDHLKAATQLAQDSASSNLNKASLTSASPTCNVLKRRRDNYRSTSIPAQLSLDIERDHPACKKARVIPTDSAYECDAISLTSSGTQPTVSAPDLVSDPSSGSHTFSSNDSNSELDQDSNQQSIVVDSPQISNLVSIFNSGFSGLCSVSSPSTPQESDHDSSNNSEFLKSNQFGSVLKRQDSLSCSSLLGRLESVPSAIILSA